MKKKRARTEQRVRQRDAQKLVRDRERAAELDVGGSPDRPIVVESSSVIEVRARSLRCPQCDAECQILEHTAERIAEVLLRAVKVRCLRCAIERTRWFKIEAPLAN